MLSKHVQVLLIRRGQSLVETLSGWGLIVRSNYLVEDASVMIVAVIQELVHFVVVEDVVDQLIHDVHKQSLVLSGLNGGNVLDLKWG